MSDLAGRDALSSYRQPRERFSQWLHATEEVDAFRHWGNGFRGGNAFNLVRGTAIGPCWRLNATPRRLQTDSARAQGPMAKGYQEKDDAKERSSVPSALHMSGASEHEAHYRSLWRTCQRCRIDRLRQGVRKAPPGQHTPILIIGSESSKRNLVINRGRLPRRARPNAAALR